MGFSVEVLVFLTDFCLQAYLALGFLPFLEKFSLLLSGDVLRIQENQCKFKDLTNVAQLSGVKTPVSLVLVLTAFPMLYSTSLGLFL